MTEEVILTKKRQLRMMKELVELRSDIHQFVSRKKKKTS